jgi:hypothetical protein
MRCHSLRSEVGGVRQYAGQHGRDVSRNVTRADMCEVVRKTGPIVHLPQEVRHLNHWIHIADIGIQLVCGGRDFAGGRRDD